LWQRLDRSQAETLLAIPLAGDAIVEGASGMLIISRDGQNGALVVDSLPTLDADQAYQLWLIKDDHRASGAIFTVDEAGYGGTRVEAPELLFEYSAAGVTIEPAGGSSGPTGERVLFGEFPDL
jgi:anti-sigma-K factor RskA